MDYVGLVTVLVAFASIAAAVTAACRHSDYRPLPEVSAAAALTDPDRMWLDAVTVRDEDI